MCGVRPVCVGEEGGGEGEQMACWLVAAAGAVALLMFNVLFTPPPAQVLLTIVRMIEPNNKLASFPHVPGRCESSLSTRADGPSSPHPLSPKPTPKPQYPTARRLFWTWMRRLSTHDMPTAPAKPAATSPWRWVSRVCPQPSDPPISLSRPLTPTLTHTHTPISISFQVEIEDTVCKFYVCYRPHVHLFLRVVSLGRGRATFFSLTVCTSPPPLQMHAGGAVVQPCGVYS